MTTTQNLLTDTLTRGTAKDHRIQDGDVFTYGGRRTDGVGGTKTVHAAKMSGGYFHLTDVDTDLPAGLIAPATKFWAAI